MFTQFKFQMVYAGFVPGVITLDETIPESLRIIGPHGGKLCRGRIPHVDQMQLREIRQGEGCGQFQNLPAQPFVLRIGLVGIQIDGSQDTGIVGLFVGLQQPEWARALAQQVHVIAAEQPIKPARILGGLHNQIMAFTQNGADHLDKPSPDHHLYVEVDVFAVRCDRVFEYLASVGN